jgi:hypothetical protein
MAIINTGSYPKALMEGVKLWWDAAAKESPQFAPLMFQKETSSKNYEEYVQSVGLGLARVKAEGQAITYDGTQQGFVTRGTNIAYGLGIITTYEELQDNLYVKLTKERAMQLRKAFAETKNVVATNIFNRAFSGSFVGGDGSALLSATHPNFTSGTWSNRLSADAAFSQTALEDMLTMLSTNRNDRGYVEPLAANRLIVHPSNFFNAERVLKTSKAVGNNFNDINPINTSNLVPGGLVSNPYLAAAGPWFLTTNAQNGLIWQEREALGYWEDNDHDTRNFKLGAYERYTMLWANPRGCFGSNAA